MKDGPKLSLRPFLHTFDLLFSSSEQYISFSILRGFLELCFFFSCIFTVSCINVLNKLIYGSLELIKPLNDY